VRARSFAGLVCAAIGAEATVTDQEQILFLMEENKQRMCEGHPTRITSDQILCRVYNWGEDCSHLRPPFDVRFTTLPATSSPA
jgi:hypothetical protein